MRLFFVKRDKRGINFLMGNLLFIILNVTFLMILILFVYSKSSSLSFYEEVYAKQIALALDYAKPGMVIEINMENTFAKIKKKLGEDEIPNAVLIEENQVRVRLSKESKGYSYTFFKDISIDSNYWHPEKTGIYVIITGEYNNE